MSAFVIIKKCYKKLTYNESNQFHSIFNQKNLKLPTLKQQNYLDLGAADFIAYHPYSKQSKKLSSLIT